MPASPPGTTTQSWVDRYGGVYLTVTYHFDPDTGVFDSNQAITYTNFTEVSIPLLVVLPSGSKALNVPVADRDNDGNPQPGSVNRQAIINFTDGEVDNFFAGSWTIVPLTI